MIAEICPCHCSRYGCVHSASFASTRAALRQKAAEKKCIHFFVFMRMRIKVWKHECDTESKSEHTCSSSSNGGGEKLYTFLCFHAYKNKVWKHERDTESTSEHRKNRIPNCAIFQHKHRDVEICLGKHSRILYEYVEVHNLSLSRSWGRNYDDSNEYMA